MRQRPWPIVILAILHVIAGPFNLLLGMLLSPHPMSVTLREYGSPAYRSFLLFYVLAPIVAGVAIYICKKWSFWLYVVTMAVICIGNYQAMTMNQFDSRFVRFILFALIDIGIVIYFFIPAVRAIYFDPRLRWWESSPRYRTEIPASWTSDDGEHLGQITNFSSGGLFFKSSDEPVDNSFIDIHFSLDGESYVFKGSAIKHTHQNRLGFGFRFLPSPETEKASQKLTKKFASEDRLMTDRQFHPEDRFTVWLENVVLKRGKGLVPEARARK